MAGDSLSGHGDQSVILVTGGYDHTVKLWQAHSGVCLRTMQHPDSQVNGLDITPDGQMVAACGYQHIRMYDLASANPDPVLNYDRVVKNVTRVGFQEDGKWMYSGGEDNTAKIWDLRSNQLQCQRMLVTLGPVNAVCLHPDQSQIMVGDQLGNIYMWDLKTDKNEQLIPEAEASIQDIAIDPEGKLMAAVNNKGSCYIWTLTGEPSKSKPRKHIKAHSKYALRCKFSPDSTMLVTTSGDCAAAVWRTSDWSRLRELRADAQRWVWDAAFSGDSRYLFTGSSDSYARLWDVEKGTLEREYCGHQKPITALAFRDQMV